jgi:SP family sugar:H+ symporter-like MFS transporter
MLSAFIQMVGMLVLGGIGTAGWPILPRFLPVTVVMLVLITAGFSIGFASLTHVVTTEITSQHLRDMTQRAACCITVLSK